MKQLNINGSEITNYTLKIVSRTQKNSVYEDLNVEIVTFEKGAEHSYKYTMHSDGRVPSVEWLEQELEKRLKAAKNDYLPVKIREYTERSYLFIEVGGNRFEILQVTGRRLQ